MKKIALERTKLQRIISTTLRSGVAAASVIGVCGGTLYLLGQGAQKVDFHLFAVAGVPYSSLAGIEQALCCPDRAQRDLAIAQLGILVLLLTPILRVALSVLGFLLEKDRMYVLITSTVLVTLTASILLH